MSLISHKHQFIFTKTVKTGSTSVECYFERFCMRPEDYVANEGRDEYFSEVGIVGHRGHKHYPTTTFYNLMPLSEMQDKLGAEVWDKYFKFSLVRNPWDKMVSAFYWHQKTYLGKTLRKISDLSEDKVQFELFLRGAHGLAFPQDRGQYFVDGNFVVDDFVRYENMKADVERISNIVGVEWNPSWLLRYKSGVRPINALTKFMYTDVTRKLVEQHYDVEVEYFKYTCPV